MIERDLPPHHEDFIGFMEQAFPDVLGISLQDITNDYDFRQRVQQLEEFKQEIQDPDLEVGKVWRYSMSHSAYFINADEKEKKERTDDEKSVIIEGILASPYNTALVEAFSKLLVEKVATTLPKELAEAADAWKGANDKEKKDILEFVYERLEYDFWRYANPKYEDVEDEYGNDIYDVSASHPDNIVHWPHSERTNCLGVSLLMVGFAHRAGAKFLYTNTIRHRHEDGDDIRGTAVEQMRKAAELMDLQLGFIWDDFFSRHDNQMNVTDAHVSYFHHAVAIKVGDDWTYLDPYLKNLITLQNNYYNIPLAHKEIMRTEKFGPGRTIIASADMLMKSYHETFSEVAEHITTICKGLQEHLEKLIKINGNASFDFNFFRQYLSTFDVASVFEDQSVVERFGFAHENWSTETFLELLLGNILTDQRYREAFSTKRRKQDGDDKGKLDIPESIDGIINCLDFDINARFRDDPSFRQRIIDDVIFQPMYIYAIQTESREFENGRKMPDTTIELTNPYFLPGLLLLNHLRTWSTYGNKYVSTAIAELTSSQVLWHAAVMDDVPYVTGQLEELGGSLEGLGKYLLHKRVAWKLAELAINREAKVGQKADTAERGQEDRAVQG